MSYQIIDVVQGSDEWKEVRKGKITWTRLKQVVSKTKSTRDNLIYELIGECIAPVPESFKSSSMERWNICEVALKEICPEMQSVWFIEKNDWIGLSPDGVVIENWEIVHWYEIKCPEVKTFVKYCIEWWIPDEYFYQVIHYFIVVDTLRTLDLCFYNPEIRDPRMRKRAITVSRGELAEDIEKAQNALVSFRKEWESAIEKLVLLTK